MSSPEAFASDILATMKRKHVRYQGDPVTVTVETSGWIEVVFLSLIGQRPQQKKIRINVTPVIERDNFDAVHGATEPEIVVCEIERVIEDIKNRALLTPKNGIIH